MKQQSLQKKGLIPLQGLLELFLSFGWNEAECSIHDQKFSPQLLKADIIVMKVLYIVLMLVLLMSCNSNQQKDIKTSYDKQELLFTSSGVNDSLYSFISSIDSIPNPYGQSIEYMVRYSIEDEDTIITFHAAVDFTPATDMSIAYKHDSSPEIIIGGAYCGDKPVLVRSSGRYDYPLLRKEMLDESTGLKIDSVKIPLDNPMGWDAPMTMTYKRYKYSYPDSLTLYEYWHLGKLVFER